jgi:hypothetical protein
VQGGKGAMKMQCMTAKEHTAWCRKFLRLYGYRGMELDKAVAEMLRGKPVRISWMPYIDKP